MPVIGTNPFHDVTGNPVASQGANIRTVAAIHIFAAMCSPHQMAQFLDRSTVSVEERDRLTTLAWSLADQLLLKG
jgi:hypothetical protein